MTITTAAADLIRHFLRASETSHPVIYLAQVSDVPAELDQAVKRGAPRKEILEVAAKALPTERKYLYPLVYPGSHFLWLTNTTDGFRFAAVFFHPPRARQALKRGLLDVAERGLVLKDIDGTVVLPQHEVSAP